MTELFDLSGRTALVTGAGSGLGAGFARTLARAGARVVLAARRRDKLEHIAAEISASGGNALVVALDVTRSQSIDDCFSDLDRQGVLADIVVNNAGISREIHMAKLPEADWDAVLDTNLKGVFLVAQAAASRLIAAGTPGSIVNLASVLGVRVSPTLGAYCVTKAGVIQLTCSLALEWARYGIRVNAIAPGYFVTEMNQEFFETDASDALIKRIPQRRVGEVADLAGPLLLLASEAGAYVTGITLTVDGGLILQ